MHKGDSCKEGATDLYFLLRNIKQVLKNKYTWIVHFSGTFTEEYFSIFTTTFNVFDLAVKSIVIIEKYSCHFLNIMTHYDTKNILQFHRIIRQLLDQNVKCHTVQFRKKILFD